MAWYNISQLFAASAKSRLKDLHITKRPENDW